MRLLISIILLLNSFIIFSQEFYYYKDFKIHLTNQRRKAYLQLSKYDDNDRKFIESKGWTVTHWIKTEGHRSFQLINEKYVNEIIYGIFIETNLINVPIPYLEYSFYSSYFYLNEDNNKVECVPSPMFYVELKNLNDFNILYKTAEEKNVEILGSIHNRPEFYVLRCKHYSKQSSIELSRKFKETNLFASCEPDLIGLSLTNCINDPKFGDQWGLKNTGQFGGTPNFDVKACDAWNLTKGNSNIIIAVIDEGIELTHSDLLPNLSALSFNTMTNASPSALHGGHGTLCAGIAAARGDNGIYGSGVAPNCKLMSISNTLLLSNGNMAAQIALGFDYARLNNASIISNSYFVPAQNTILDKAISDALAMGRNGAGCVVVFAVGNDASSVRYPANSHPDIIAVGAIDNNGIHASFSNFGYEIDVVAPGVNIRSTTNSSGFSSVGANGTSFACPHVSGVAALILSVNPCLSQKGVHDIICKTALKTIVPVWVPGLLIGSALGISILRDPLLGAWHPSYGHGLVDAYESVLLASNPNFYLQNKDVSSQKNYSYKKILAGQNVDISSTPGNYRVLSGGILSLKASESIELKDGFSVLNGGVFHALIDHTHCNFSNPILKVSKAGGKTISSSQNTSLISNKLSPIFSAYPNPTMDLVNIEYTLFDDSRLVIEVYDIQGKLIHLDNMLKATGTYKLELDIFRTLHSGQYFVNIIAGEHKESFKIVKENAK